MFRMTAVETRAGRVAVITSHVGRFHQKLCKQDELRAFLEAHSLGWWHRVRHARGLHRLSMHVHGDRNLAAKSVLMFLSPKRVANWIAKL